MTYIPEPLRRIVGERAGGRCEYCRLHEDDTFFTHEVDHIYAEKHDGPTVEWNLCLACAECGSPGLLLICLSRWLSDAICSHSVTRFCAWISKCSGEPRV